MADQIDVATDGIVRCLWPGMDKFYMEYHDNEWGVPIGDDAALFERICLEGFQSGLSWITILRKRKIFVKLSKISILKRLPDLMRKTFKDL